jgi:chitinase
MPTPFRLRGTILKLGLEAASGLLFRPHAHLEIHVMPSRFRWLPCSFLLLIAVIMAASTPRAQAQNAALTKRVVADYGYWSKYQTPPYGHAQIPYHMLTHINHAGVGFDSLGTLQVPDGFIEPELNNLAHAAGVKVLLLLGGDFPGVEASGAVQLLVDNIAAFEKQYHYDGLDIDWEYPASTADRLFLVQLMKLLRESNPDYTLSIDVAPWGGTGYALKPLQLTTDYFNIMMYDCAGPWTADGQLNSPIFWNYHDPDPWECQPGGSVHDAANIYLLQVPPKQLNMGTPFYGYFYTNINAEFATCPNAATSSDGDCDNPYVLTVNYFPQVEEYLKNVGNGWEVHRDPIAMVPYLLHPNGRDGFVTYDDPTSTYYRVWYSDWDRGLGGTFMWSLDADYNGQTQPLLSAMYSASLAGN